MANVSKNQEENRFAPVNVNVNAHSRRGFNQELTELSGDHEPLHYWTHIKCTHHINNENIWNGLKWFCTKTKESARWLTEFLQKSSLSNAK